MARGSRRLCRRLLLPSEGLALVLASPALAAEQGIDASLAPPAPVVLAAADEDGAVVVAASTLTPVARVQDMVLVLDVTVNGEKRGLARFTLLGGSLRAPRETLGRLGFVFPAGASDTISLSDLAGVVVRYDGGAQTLDLVAPLEMLDTTLTRLNTETAGNPRASAAPGVLLNYDAYANIGRAVSFDTFAELRAFNGNGVVDTTMLARFGERDGGWRGNAVRLDSAFTRSFPDKRLTLRVGDTLTAATSWSRSTRIGGVQFGTNFALQPYLVTVPLPSFVGSATLPSSVELYIDGMKRYSGEVPAGPFELGTGAGRISGAGRAEVVITDMLGRVSTLDFLIYDTPRLLAPGLSDWSVELGTVRENYGLRSFDYDSRPVMSGTWRHGLTDHLTVEAHGEASKSLLGLGVGGAWLVGQAGGVITGSLAGSRAQDREGYQAGLGYSWTNGRFHAAVETLRASRHYADVATRWSLPPPRARDNAQIGFSTRGFGSLGAHYLRQEYQDGQSYRYAGLNWNLPLGRRFSLSASASQNLDDRSDRGVFVSLGFSPASRNYFTAGYQHQRGFDGVFASAQRSASLAGGIGWRADVRHDELATRGAAQATWLGPVGEARAGIGAGGGSTAGYLGWSGSLVLMEGQAFAARRIDDSFAVVTTDGVADVPVKLQNNVVGRTGGSGKLLVTRLNAYQRNQVSIDPAGLPATSRVEVLDREAVPTDRAGVVVRFPIRTFSALMLTVVDEDGQALPPGTPVHVTGGLREPLVIGFDGRLYVEDLAPGEALLAGTADGECRIALPEVAAEGIVRTGPVSCLPTGRQEEKTP